MGHDSEGTAGGHSDAPGPRRRKTFQATTGASPERPSWQNNIDELADAPAPIPVPEPARVFTMPATTLPESAATPPEPPPLIEPPAPAQAGPVASTIGVDYLLLTAAPPSPDTVAVPPPGSALPAPPRRRALEDDDLAQVVEQERRRTGSARGAIDELETQLQLREEESGEFFAWERSMRAIGTPEALAEVDRRRPSFTGMIPLPDLSGGPSLTVVSPPEPPPVTQPASGIASSPQAVSADQTQPFNPPSSSRLDLESWEDEVDESDRATAGAAPQPPIGVPAATSEQLKEAGPHLPPAFVVEENRGEPSLLEQRAGRASRLFWLWFAANSSVISVAFGAALFSLGMSVRQSLVAVLAGVALSFVPLGLTSLAGKWSGQATMFVSRAAFGLFGNIVPSVLALVTRIFWGAVVLWLFAVGAAQLLESSGLDGGLGSRRLTVIALAVGFFLAIVIAFFGYALLARVYLVLSILSAVLLLGFVVFTWSAIDIPAALSIADGSWVLVATGAVLVFSFLGLAWANSGADLARYQRVGGSGAASMLWATIGTTLPSLILMSYGALLAASDPQLSRGLLENPFASLAGLLPSWYPIPLIAAFGLSLVCALVLTMYSGAFSLQAVGVSLRRPVAVLVVGVLIAVCALSITFGELDFTAVMRDLATTIAVPVAAWVGIFAADLMIRNRRFDSRSLLRRGGIYPDVDWVNLGMLVLATAIGWGLTTATMAGLGWQGYIFTLAGVPLDSVIAEADLGVIAALVLGLLSPVLFGIPAIRRQERARG